MGGNLVEFLIGSQQAAEDSSVRVRGFSSLVQQGLVSECVPESIGEDPDDPPPVPACVRAPADSSVESLGEPMTTAVSPLLPQRAQACTPSPPAPPATSAPL